MVDDAEFYGLEKKVIALQKEVKRNHKTFISAGKDMIWNDQELARRIKELDDKVAKMGKR
jgi:hypothetical protein